jgi:hypothetical protein
VANASCTPRGQLFFDLYGAGDPLNVSSVHSNSYAAVLLQSSDISSQGLEEVVLVMLLQLIAPQCSSVTATGSGICAGHICAACIRVSSIGFSQDPWHAAAAASTRPGQVACRLQCSTACAYNA